MWFSTALVALVATMSAAQASPAGAPSSMDSAYLWNGTHNVLVQFHRRQASDVSDLLKRVRTDCQGSDGCSNEQSFKDDCSDAYFKVEDTTYTSRGAGSGVCSGKCGLFVAGPTSCYASGSQLSNAYNTIRGNGCEACGREFDYGTGATDGACALQIDYVEGCTA